MGQATVIVAPFLPSPPCCLQPIGDASRDRCGLRVGPDGNKGSGCRTHRCRTPWPGTDRDLKNRNAAPCCRTRRPCKPDIWFPPLPAARPQERISAWKVLQDREDASAFRVSVLTVAPRLSLSARTPAAAGDGSQPVAVSATETPAGQVYSFAEKFRRTSSAHGSPRGSGTIVCLRIRPARSSAHRMSRALAPPANSRTAAPRQKMSERTARPGTSRRSFPRTR